MAYVKWDPYHGDDWKDPKAPTAEYREALKKMQEEERKRHEAFEAYAELDQSEDLNDDPRVRKLF